MKTFYSKALALVCAVLAIGMLNVNSLQAQGGPACLPDCPQSFFTPEGMLPPLDFEVPGQPGCTLTVSYGYRNACNIWHDFFIYSITASGSCSPGFLADPNAIVQTATALLFMSNPPTGSGSVGPSKPGCGDVNCVTNWRVIKGSCWRGDGDGNFIACEETTCCLQPYQICRDYCDNITVTSYGSSGGQCNSSQPGCVPVCN